MKTLDHRADALGKRNDDRGVRRLVDLGRGPGSAILTPHQRQRVSIQVGPGIVIAVLGQALVIDQAVAQQPRVEAFGHVHVPNSGAHETEAEGRPAGHDHGVLAREAAAHAADELDDLCRERGVVRHSLARVHVFEHVREELIHRHHEREFRPQLDQGFVEHPGLGTAGLDQGDLPLRVGEGAHGFLGPVRRGDDLPGTLLGLTSP